MRFATPLRGLAVALLALAWAGPAAAQPFPAGQDTVDVPQGGPNNLFDAITNDTNDGTPTGTRLNANRVYRLARGARYLMLTSLAGDYHLNVVAAKPTAAAPNSKPPIIQRFSADNGDFPETLANTTGDQTWKGVYFLSPTPSGSNSFFVIRSGGEDAVLTFDDVTFEYVSGIAIQFDAIGSSLFVRNSRFRNFVNTQQIYAGRAAYFVNPGTADKPGARDVVFENNTFSTIGGFIFQGPRKGTGVEIERFRFNHNTVFGVGLYPFLEEQWTDALLLNNLFTNALYYGETVANRTGQDPDRLPYGVFNVDELRDGQATSEDDRRIGVIANANYRDVRYDEYYASTADGDATKVFGAPFVNSRAQGLFDARASFVLADLLSGEAPGFTAPPTNVPLTIQFTRDIRSSPVPAEPTNYAYDPDGSVNTVTWPLPENLAYSNAAYRTGGINDRPLGDLNWFPAQKAAWVAAGGAQTDYTAANQRIDGGGTGADLPFAEAESVQLTGNTSVLSSGDRGDGDENASGGQYVYMEDTGTITWTFDAATAGDFTLRIRHQLPFGDKAQKLSLNGEALIKDDNGTRYFFTGDTKVWKNADIDVTLKAGQNTFVITKDFGYMYFDSFAIVERTGTAGEDGPNGAFQVSNAYPNPTTGRAQVALTLTQPAQVSVSVYDLLGRLVLSVPEATMSAGADRPVAIDGSTLPDGTYLYRVEARQNGGVQSVTGRMTVIR